MCIWNDQIRVPTYLNFNYIYPIYYLHKTYISDVSSLFGMKFESAMSLLKFNFPQSYLPFVELHCHLGNKFIHELTSHQFLVRIPGGLWYGFNHVDEYTQQKLISPLHIHQSPAVTLPQVALFSQLHYFELDPKKTPVKLFSSQ